MNKFSIIWSYKGIEDPMERVGVMRDSIEAFITEKNVLEDKAEEAHNIGDREKESDYKVQISLCKYYIDTLIESLIGRDIPELLEMCRIMRKANIVLDYRLISGIAKEAKKNGRN